MKKIFPLPSALAPYDRIIVTATSEYIPDLLLDQLKDGGKMILPLKRATGFEDLVLITKTGETISHKKLIGVRFVPLVE